MEQTTLSKYVKAMRKQYNLTQVELSEKSGVGLRLVRELEQGKQTLRLDKVNQILNLFGSDIRSRASIFQFFSAISKSQPSGIKPSKNGNSTLSR